jgi:outer membrane cobalamin receptor
VDPETIQTYELLLEQKMSQSVMLNVSLFQYDMTDLIGLVEQADGVVIYENIAESEASGVELEAIARYQNGVETRASYTYTDAEDSETGEHLTNSPENLAKLQAGMPFFSRKLFAGAEVQYIGERLNSYRDPVRTTVWHLTLSSSIWKVWIARQCL